MSKNSEDGDTLVTVPIGKVIGAHGVEGEIKFKPYGGLEDFDTDGIELDSVFIGCGVKDPVQARGRRGHNPREFKVISQRPHKGALLLTLEGVEDRDAAEKLSGCEVSIKKSALPKLPEGEYYQFELVGMEVFTEEGRPLGRITGILSTGSNDVFEVMGSAGEVLVPATTETMIEVDTEKKRLVVRLMDGLMPGAE